MAVRSIQVSEFKAKCIATLKEVDASGEAIVITLRGKALARVEPIARGRRLGMLRDSLSAKRDLVKTDFDEEWELEPRPARRSR